MKKIVFAVALMCLVQQSFGIKIALKLSFNAIKPNGEKIAYCIYKTQRQEQLEKLVIWPDATTNITMIRNTYPIQGLLPGFSISTNDKTSWHDLFKNKELMQKLFEVYKNELFKTAYGMEMQSGKKK